MVLCFEIVLESFFWFAFAIKNWKKVQRQPKKDCWVNVSEDLEVSVDGMLFLFSTFHLNC